MSLIFRAAVRFPTLRTPRSVEASVVSLKNFSVAAEPFVAEIASAQRRSYTSRAHPRPTQTVPVPEAMNMVVRDVEERKVSREERFDRNKPVIRHKLGLDKDADLGPFRNQDETIELVLNINVDPRKPGQSLRGMVALPHGSGKKRRVAVFTSSGDCASAARDAGALHAGGEELVDEILSGTVSPDSFDVALASPDMMSVLGSRAARILGPRGRCPVPR